MSRRRDGGCITERGFTLVEVLLVIIVLSVLAAVAVLALRGLGDDAQSNVCKAELRSVEGALAAYVSQFGSPPTSISVADLRPYTDGDLGTNWELTTSGTSIAISAAAGGDCTGITP
jgi:prepilin-type N-terminal cleavage/methylation domain-containing protein